MTETTKKEGNTLIDRMFQAGAHFGFSKSRRHPSVTPFLFGVKQGYDIFDLEKTSVLLNEATQFMKEMGTLGKRVLLVGTKEEVREIIKAEALKADVPYVVNRWVGGTLTNFSEIKKRIEHFASLTKSEEAGEFEKKFTKKERVMIKREMGRLEESFGGIMALERIPDVILVVDPRADATAVTEAHHMHIPVVGVLSSDCNARLINKPVVINDSHRASVVLALTELLHAYEEGRATLSTEKK